MLGGGRQRYKDEGKSERGKEREERLLLQLQEGAPRPPLSTEGWASGTGAARLEKQANRAFRQRQSTEALSYVN